MALRHGQPIPNATGAPGVPTAWDPYCNQAATQAYAQTLRQQPQTPQQTPASSQSTPPSATSSPNSSPQQPPQSDNQILSIFQQYGGLVLNALNQGVSGDAFAEYVACLLGTSTHAMIANNGEDALVGTMMAIPEFQLFGEQRIRRFV